VKLLVFNLAMDLDHSMLGFAARWVSELASQVERIEVITMTRGRVDVPPNVVIHSVGKERGWSEPHRALEFYRILHLLLQSRSVDVCFSHMMPLFTAMGGPLLRCYRVPVVTWYAHPSLTWVLRAAHYFSDRMVTSLPQTYPYRRTKLMVIGQGIDTRLFRPIEGLPAHPPIVLCVSRLSPVKDQLTLLRAAALVLRRRPSLPFDVVLLGEAAPPHGPAYAAELRAAVTHLGLEKRVRFEPPVDAVALPQWYGRAAVHVNLTPAGFGDKVAWEAMSCGWPCLVANTDLTETLGRHAEELFFPPGDVEALANRLEAVLAAGEGYREAIGGYLRTQVERLHSLDHLVEELMCLFGALGVR